MSTNWRLYCLDCDNDEAGFSLNHGDDTLLAMLDVAPLLAPLADPQQHQAVWDYGLVINCQQVPLEWIWSHQGQGHRVGVRSEYGEVKPHGERTEQQPDESRAQSSGEGRGTDVAGQQPAELGDRTAGVPALHP